MESAAAVKMWMRSLQHNFKYTTMLSDGDTSSLAKVNEAQPYGPDQLVEKEECINHVSKRLPNNLKNVITEYKARGITPGGKGEGTLTEQVITKLATYYRYCF